MGAVSNAAGEKKMAKAKHGRRLLAALNCFVNGLWVCACVE